MKNLKHTQGEWSFDINANKGFDVFVKDSIKTIATVHFKGASYMPTEDEAQANAKLIASAPELLDALKTALAIFGKGYEPKEGVVDTIGSETYLKMLNAINKATL